MSTNIPGVRRAEISSQTLLRFLVLVSIFGEEKISVNFTNKWLHQRFSLSDLLADFGKEKPYLPNVSKLI